MYTLLAQAAQDYTVEETTGINLLNTAINITRSTAQSWNQLWGELIAPNGELWAGLCNFAITLALICIILLSLKMFVDYSQGRFFWSDLIATSIWPLVIIIFLANNGSLLANTVIVARNIASSQVTAILNIQVADLSFRQAITNVTLSVNAKQQILALYKECQGKQAQERTTCLQEKQPLVEQIVAEAERVNGGPIAALQQLLNDLRNSVLNPSSTLTGAIAGAAVFTFLLGLQWAFVNILEAALIMTATFAPIAMALSMLPVGTKSIWAWASGFISLFGIQLGYNILIGMVATVIVAAGVQSATDLAFVIFISICAPVLAVAIAGGGGIALYSSINRSTTELASKAAAIAGTAVGAIVGGVAGGPAGAVAGASADSAVAGAAREGSQYSTIE
jgi:hypothetical protein